MTPRFRVARQGESVTDGVLSSDCLREQPSIDLTAKKTESFWTKGLSIPVQYRAHYPQRGDAAVGGIEKQLKRKAVTYAEQPKQAAALVQTSVASFFAKPGQQMDGRGVPPVLPKPGRAAGPVLGWQVGLQTESSPLKRKASADYADCKVDADGFIPLLYRLEMKSFATAEAVPEPEDEPEEVIASPKLPPLLPGQEVLSVKGSVVSVGRPPAKVHFRSSGFGLGEEFCHHPLRRARA